MTFGNVIFCHFSKHLQFSTIHQCTKATASVSFLFRVTSALATGTMLHIEKSASEIRLV